MDSGSRHRIMLIALFLAPFTIIVFAFLWGLNPTTSYPMIVRVYDFLDIGIAIAVGVGLAYIAKKLTSKNARMAICALFVVCCFATTSIAYNSQKVFEIQNTTYEYEADALGWIKAKNTADMNISTDRRMWEIGHNLYDLEGDYGLPIIMKTQSLPKNRICIFETQWMRSPGAQMYPLDSIIVPRSDITNQIMVDNNILASIGPPDNAVYIMVRPIA
jgi:hypothetical protein